MAKVIYDNTPEDDNEFMIERINKLQEYLAIEKNKSYMLEQQAAALQNKINQQQTKITILESNENNKRHK
jgi:hypothetical protein